MSDFPITHSNEPLATDLNFAPVKPIEIEPSFTTSSTLDSGLDSSATTSGLPKTSNNPFSGDTHTGLNSGLNSTDSKIGSHTGSTTTSNSVQDTKQTVINSASSAADTIKNHPITQNAINHPITQNAINGPIATSVKDEASKTGSEFSNLAASRASPNTYTATGQPLTHYHSFFTTLLSWDNPRASGLAYGALVVFIFAARYLHILKYAFKLTWVTLGITVLAEVAGQTVLNTGLTSQFRPRKYFTLSKDTLNALVGDVHELINFFVIEAQRIVFVENILISAAAFVASFVSYFLIKVVPFWGLTLIGSTVVFLAPLIYKTNKQLIDEQLQKAANLANQQTQQMKQLASEQAARATSTTKQVVGDYSAKAQELIGTASAKARSASPTATKKENAAATLKNNTHPVTTKATTSSLNKDFPVAPKNDFVGAAPTTTFPVAPQTDFTTGATASHKNTESLL